VIRAEKQLARDLLFRRLIGVESKNPRFRHMHCGVIAAVGEIKKSKFLFCDQPTGINIEKTAKT